jgi:hypothetical protein
MWNMSKMGFEELYEKLPSPKLGFDDVWRLTGGNPDMLARLYQAKWDSDVVVRDVVDFKKLDVFVSSLTSDERRYLFEAIEDPGHPLGEGEDTVAEQAGRDELSRRRRAGEGARALDRRAPSAEGLGARESGSE